MNCCSRILLVVALGLALTGSLFPRAKPDSSADAAADRAQESVQPGKVFVYKHSGGEPRELEVYFPPHWSADKKLPAVIFFHGGGWAHGTVDQFRYACRYFASRGLVAVTASYQLASTTGDASRKRVCLIDVKSAIRWMKQHAPELGIDPARLIAGGGSAGGHLAVLATLNSGLNDPADPKNIDTSVVAWLLYNPAFDSKDSADPEVDVQKQLKPGTPPAIFFFGTTDRWKAGFDSVRERFKTAAGSGNELWLAEGKAHGFFNGQPWLDLTLAKSDHFLAGLGLLEGSATLSPPKSGAMLVKAP